MTKQEMFDRAVRGLHSQQWETCVDGNNNCVYADGVRHCAWGWVDTSLTVQLGSVATLREAGIGLAASLSPDEEKLASAMQSAHDSAGAAYPMRDRFLALAERFGLTWPEGC